MATDLTCGSGGSTGQEVIDRINGLTSLDLRATGRLTAPETVTITDTTTLVLPVADEARTQRGGFEVDITRHALVNASGKAYDSVIVTVGLNVRFPGNEQLDIWVYVNDVAYSAVEFTMQGRGNQKPQSIFWQSDVSLADGDIIDIRGTSPDAGTSYDLVIERTQFRIDADYKDGIA